MGRITDEQIDFAKSISLTGLASSMGYTVIRRGHYYILKEMDSLTIYNDRTWYRWSGKGEKQGGSTIDFVIEFGNFLSSENIFIQAVNYLLEYGGYGNLSRTEKVNAINLSRKKISEEEVRLDKKMELPKKAQGGYKRAYAYLIQKRGISTETINYFVKNNLLYEDAVHHNLVFLGYDKDGNVKFATKRGTADINGQRYRGDVEGNDKNYGVNIVNKESDEVNVFEACIDMMSYCDLSGETDRTNKLALSMLDDKPLRTFLKENPQIKNINLYLDNDERGSAASTKIKKEYSEEGYNVTDYKVPAGKDLNEYLLFLLEEPSIKNNRGR